MLQITEKYFRIFKSQESNVNAFSENLRLIAHGKLKLYSLMANLEPHLISSEESHMFVNYFAIAWLTFFVPL